MNVKITLDCCENCTAFLADEDQESKEGFCRPGPPTLLLTDPIKKEYISVFGRMQKIGWCRAFEKMKS